jgi:hypothetical protein
MSYGSFPTGQFPLRTPIPGLNLPVSTTYQGGPNGAPSVFGTPLTNPSTTGSDLSRHVVNPFVNVAVPVSFRGVDSKCEFESELMFSLRKAISPHSDGLEQVRPLSQLNAHLQTVDARREYGTQNRARKLRDAWVFNGIACTEEAEPRRGRTSSAVITHKMKGRMMIPNVWLADCLVPFAEGASLWFLWVREQLPSTQADRLLGIDPFNSEEDAEIKDTLTAEAKYKYYWKIRPYVCARDAEPHMELYNRQMGDEGDFTGACQKIGYAMRFRGAVDTNKLCNVQVLARSAVYPPSITYQYRTALVQLPHVEVCLVSTAL